MRPVDQLRVFRYTGAIVSLVAMGFILQPRASGVEVLVAGVFLLVALTLLTEN